MSQSTGELLVIERHPKAGTALVVEQGMDAMLDDPTVIHRVFNDLSKRLPVSAYDPTVPAKREIQRFNRAEKMRQLAYATTAALVGRIALPAMVEHVDTYGRLTIGDKVLFDPHLYAEFGSQSIPSYRVLRAAHHLVRATEVVVDAMEREDHPYHPLYTYLNSTTTEYYDAWDEWSGGPGLNRWPYHIDAKRPDGRHTLLASLCLNLQLGASLAAAKAVHHMIYENKQADSAELLASMERALPNTLRILSTDRHLGWTEDWLDKIQRGEPVGSIPEDGVAALLLPTRDQMVAPGDRKRGAAVDGLPIMQNPEFCAHASIRNGPIAKAGSCAGDPWIRYKDPKDRQAAQDFFNRMGYTLADGSFNFGGVAIAMGKRLVAEEVLPFVAQS
jgi:hypothetical protein